MRTRAEPANEVTHKLSRPTTLIASAYQTSWRSRMRFGIPFTVNCRPSKPLGQCTQANGPAG
jgi:hypothetical protein